MAMNDEELSADAAQAVFDGFGRLARSFSSITSRAPDRFQARDWAAARDDVVLRLDAGPVAVNGVVGELELLLTDRIDDRLLWSNIRARYEELMAPLPARALGQTFFNSVTRRVFVTTGVDPEIEFLGSPYAIDRTPEIHLVSYQKTGQLHDLIETVLEDSGLRSEFSDLHMDAKRAARLLIDRVASEITGVNVIRTLLYREQAAYRVGQIDTAGDPVPFSLVLRHSEQGLVLDAVLVGESAVSILFSFTRSHFHLSQPASYELVPFLQELMPRKRLSELYTALGYHKHGKSLVYREIMDNLTDSPHSFQPAAGTPGLVMMVFAMPEIDLVFKVLRDKFKPPKRTTRRQVRATYDLVFKHDRAGRLIDASEFEHLQLNRSRFDPAVLEELLAECSATVSLVGDQVNLDHVYIERRVNPLNLVVRGDDRVAAEAAVIDYGQAIKDMAVANVFPGDLLLKNFGLTRHGRVVFYDYDEIALVTDCVFRTFPEPEPGDEMSDVPMWGVGPNDIFPEEFRRFLGLPADLREVFTNHHSDLLTADWWTEIQSRVEDGELIEIPPYSDEFRLSAG